MSSCHQHFFISSRCLRGGRTRTFPHPPKHTPLRCKSGQQQGSCSHRNTLFFFKVSLMYLVYKREALLRISHCFPLLICMTRVAAPSSPTLDLHMRSKWNSVYFLFPVGTAATCIFDYTLYIHEEGKYNPLGKIDEGDFSVLYSIALYSV